MFDKKTLTISLESLPIPPETRADGRHLSWRGGAFRTPDRLDGRTWMKIRDACSSFYVSEEEARHSRILATPGWRFTFEALLIMFQSGYTLTVAGVLVRSQVELEAALEAFDAQPAARSTPATLAELAVGSAN